MTCNCEYWNWCDLENQHCCCKDCAYANLVGRCTRDAQGKNDVKEDERQDREEGLRSYRP